MVAGCGNKTACDIMAATAMYMCLFLLLMATDAAQSTSVRGVALEMASFYRPGKEFKCLDGSSTVPFDYINDDYCDCADGSDEPGTAACPNTKFYCQNKGHVPLHLLSSRVNDGICDCCDGSDEWAGYVNCPQTCEEEGKKLAEEIKKKRDIQEQGHKKRLEYADKGEQKVNDYRQELTKLESEYDIVSAEVETLRQAKDEAEEPEKQAKDAHHERWEETKAERKEAKRTADAREAFDWLDGDSDGLVTLEEVMSHTKLDNDGDGEVTEQEAQDYLDQQQSVDFETFKDQSYDVMADKLRESMKEGDREVAEVSDEEKERLKELEEDYEDDEDDDEKVEDEDMPPYDEDTKILIEMADQARSDFKEAESRKKDLDKKKDELNTYLNMQLGEKYEFGPIFEECFEYTDREYTYKLCMFKKVTQRSKNGGKETSLGTWDKWDGPENALYSIMKYSNGEKCWNGPNRSATVTLRCGQEDAIVSAGEPNRCEYALEFVTPAVCTKPPSSGSFGPHVEL